jgi:1-deoxy-D-xylulose-5-phosphate reductoisomerase
MSKISNIARKKVSVFGSTGSVGKQIVELLQRFYLDHYQVQTISCRQNHKLVAKQALQIGAKNIVISEQCSGKNLKDELGDQNALNVICQDCVPDELILDNDLVFIGMSGIEALPILYKCITNNIKVATANKESIICAGRLLDNYTKNIIPLDSEHNAIFQLLQHTDKASLEQIILTATGGPFFGKSKTNVSIKDAVSHPVWDMGQKICVDSATMMNKVFEVIEAHYLFTMPKQNIKILIHPEALMHCILKMKSGLMHSLISSPDMRVGIDFAFKNDSNNNSGFVDLLDLAGKKMSFYTPNKEEFPSINFLDTNQHITLVAANYIATSAFLSGRIKFDVIGAVIEKTLQSYHYNPEKIFNLDDVYKTYQAAKNVAEAVVI